MIRSRMLRYLLLLFATLPAIGMANGESDCKDCSGDGSAAE
jgi:hypothetical protein